MFSSFFSYSPKNQSSKALGISPYPVSYRFVGERFLESFVVG